MTEITCKLVILALVFLGQYQTEAQLQQRIIDGLDASPKQFPYQVFLHNKEAQYYTRCGGVIITERLVLTAAHCVHNVDSVDIYFGALNINNANEVGQARLTVTPKNIVVHKDYNNTGEVNDDIALIKLPFRLIFNAYIQAARLPNRTNDYTNATILAAGWGIVDVIKRNNTYVNVVPTDLQYFKGHVLSPEDCKAQFAKLEGSQKFLDTWICSVSQNSTVCLGDSGGPIAVPDSDGSVTVVGLNSFGFPEDDGKCLPGVASFATRVSSYIDWILSNNYDLFIY